MILTLAIIFSAFLTSILVVEAASTGVTLNHTDLTAEVNEKVNFKVSVVKDTASTTPGTFIKLLDNGDGDFYEGTIGGACNNPDPDADNQFSIDANKGVCYSNSVPGNYLITVQLLDAKDGNTIGDSAEIEVVVNQVTEVEINPNVTICHANNGINPYQSITVDAKSIVNLPNGHDSHKDKGLDDKGDIIPPFDYNFGDGLMSYPGSENWTQVFSNGLTGEGIYNRGDCSGIPVGKSADMVIVKAVSTTTPIAGTNVTYNLTVTNNGPDEAKGLTLTDPLAVGLTYISASITPDTTPILSWSIGTLASGASWNVTVVAMVSSSTAGATITNTATIVGSIFDPNLDNNSASATIRPTSETTTPVETCTVKVVSDETNTVVEKGDLPAKLVTWFHNDWDAVVASPAKWIWGDDPVADPVNDTVQTFVKKFGWNGPVTSAVLTLASDNSYELSLNGPATFADATEKNFITADTIDLTSEINQGNNILSIVVKNWAMAGGTIKTNPAGLKYELIITGTAKDCDIPYDDDPLEPEEKVATIMASKIVCTNEAELPNWGMGGPNITANTATDWVNTHSSCAFAGNTEFEWAPQGATNPDTGLPVTAFYGVAGGVWNKFGPTNASGTAIVQLDSTALGSLSYIWMREVLKNEFIPFTYGPGHATNSNAVSAEMYCHVDVLNYDNYDRVDGVKVGNTYYCVAWNHPKEVEDPEDPEVPVLTCEPEKELITNGSFENEVVTDSSLWQRFASVLGWNIAKVADGASTTLELHRGWSSNQAASGAQYAELDGDHSTLISQTISTIPGKTYTLTWDFAPRQLVAGEQNELTVMVNDSMVAQNGPMVGTGTLAVADWIASSYSFVAVSSSTKISLKNEGPSDSYGTFVDDVSLRCGVNDDGDGEGDDDDNATTTPPVIDPTDDNNGGGGGSSATRVERRGMVAGASTTTPTTLIGKGGDFPQIGAVLGDQISAVPYGAPNAGRGGATSANLPLLSLLLGLCVLALIRQFRLG